ncbi:MAG: tetratricopeptide repeat protein [Candidatus Marinimicrobia bacterium]|nr:tetratricopeptide repeat protein [Candidatus Neomarinimicrobiota bacterium]
MSGLRNKSLIFFICIPLFAVEEEISQFYKNGMDAYKNGQYDLAIQEFESILSNNFDSPELYYNLGNAFFRSGNTAGAIWAFESCLKLSPTHSDAQYNLKLANLKVIDRMDLPDPPLYLKWYLGMKERFTPSAWINITLFIFLLFSLLALINRFVFFSIVKNLKGIILTLFFISLFLASHSIWTDNSLNLGVIYSPKAEVRSEPNTFSTRLFEVHEGLKVSINQLENNWVEIELLDGKTGWISNDQIRLIQ